MKTTDGWATVKQPQTTTYSVVHEHHACEIPLADMPGGTLEGRLSGSVVDGKLSLRVRSICVG